LFFPPFDIENSRYERKFVVSDMMLPQIVQHIKMHPATFSSVFHPRYINNIYLDTAELDFFYDNLSGRGSRKKARIRWYGSLYGNIGKPVLEFKIREGYLGNKISFLLPPFSFDENISQGALQQIFDKSDLPQWARDVLKHLRPSLVNRYLREYFLSFDGKFRITTDTELEYYAISANNNCFSERYGTQDVVVELKYGYADAVIAPGVSAMLPFRLTKSSKYVNGIELLHPSLV